MPPSLRSSEMSPLSSSPQSARSSFTCHTPARSPSRKNTYSPIRFPSPPTSSAVSIETSPTLSYASPQPDIEAHLLELTHAMKATLTELLNCESVRHACESEEEADIEFRSWVQARLMEKEMELKAFKKTQGRRRTSSFSEYDHTSPTRGRGSFGPESMLAGLGDALRHR